MLTFADIERRRAAAEISAAKLCAAAGVHPNTWARMRSGEHPRPHQSTLRRLLVALDCAKTRSVPAARAVYEFALRSLCCVSGRDADAVAATDFSVQRPFNAAWLDAARLRRLAIYIAVCECEQSRAVVARALNITRQAVHQAVTSVGATRGDELVGSLLDRAQRIMGRAA